MYHKIYPGEIITSTRFIREEGGKKYSGIRRGLKKGAKKKKLKAYIYAGSIRGKGTLNGGSIPSMFLRRHSFSFRSTPIRRRVYNFFGHGECRLCFKRSVFVWLNAEARRGKMIITVAEYHFIFSLKRVSRIHLQWNYFLKKGRLASNIEI